MTSASPRQGDVWLVALDPTVGDEIRKRRPAMVISRDEINGRTGSGERVVLVVPLTSTQRPGTVSIAMPPEGKGSPARVSYAVPWHLRSVSVDRLERRVHRATDEELALVARLARMLIASV